MAYIKCLLLLIQQNSILFLGIDVNEITDIANLQPDTTFDQGWIKARVISRTDGVVKTSGKPMFYGTLFDRYTNSILYSIYYSLWGEINLFSLSFRSNQDIKFKAFGVNAYRTSRILKKHNIYNISGFDVRTTTEHSQVFNYTTNPTIEIYFHDHVRIEECEPSPNVPFFEYPTMNIAAIRAGNPDNLNLIQVVGFCNSSGPLEARNIRRTGARVNMKEITIMDNTGNCFKTVKRSLFSFSLLSSIILDPEPLTVTLWCQDAEDFEGVGKVLILSGVKIKGPHFPGLATTGSSAVDDTEPPANERVMEIKQWWEARNNPGNGGNHQVQGHLAQEHAQDQVMQLPHTSNIQVKHQLIKR